MTTYSKRIFITSGTTFIPPNDFNAASNLIEVYGSSVTRLASSVDAPSGAAYASGTNIPVLPGHIVNIGIGTPSGTTDSWFNATSLANAVSQGSTLAVAAQGAFYSLSFSVWFSTPGADVSSVGNLLTYSGGLGGSASSSGGGGGAAAGPNGKGADGHAAANTGGGGGGGCNGGSSATGNSGEFGGNNRLGAGGSTSPLSPGTSGGGGCGGHNVSGERNGSAGSLDDIYGDGIHGPGSGGGAADASGTDGGNAGGYGAGGGGWGNQSVKNNGTSSGGLIVVNYNPLYGVDSLLIG